MAKKNKTEQDRMPFCKVCQTNHWARDPHNFPKEKPKPKLVK